MNAAALATALSLSAAAVLHAQRTPPVLHATADLRIDGNTNDFSRMRSLLVLRNGEIVVPQSQDHRLLYFDAQGRPAGSFGHEGAGPGEFRVVGLYGTVGDTVWVSDGQNARVTFIGPGQKLLRTTPTLWKLKSNAGDGTGLPATSNAGLLVLASYANGDFLTEASLPPNVQRPTWFPSDATSSVWVVARADGVVRRVIARNSRTPERCTTSGTINGKLHFTAWIPFCDQALRAVAQDGSRIIFVSGSDITGSETSYRVTVIAPSSDTVFTREYPYHQVPIPRHVVDSVIELRAGQPGMPADEAQIFRSMKLPATYPPVLRAFPGLDGTIWLEEPAADALHHWRILDARGEPVGIVTLPTSVTAQVADRGTVWGIDTDADGIQSVVRFTVR
jgi:hypothetical protein